MAVTLAQYLAEAQLHPHAAGGVETCVSCKVPLQETITGYRPGKDGTRCSDCYFSEISKMIDEHPVGRPMSTRASLVQEATSV